MLIIFDRKCPFLAIYSTLLRYYNWTRFRDQDKDIEEAYMAGCSGSKCIVAINNDPNANVFKTAHYGIVADCNEFLLELMEKFKALLVD